MFSQIFDAIEEWMRELLTGMITSNSVSYTHLTLPTNSRV